MLAKRPWRVWAALRKWTLFTGELCSILENCCEEWGMFKCTRLFSGRRFLEWALMPDEGLISNASPNSCVREATLKLASQTRDTTSLHKHWVQKDYKMLSLVHYTAILHMLPLTEVFETKILQNIYYTLMFFDKKYHTNSVIYYCDFKKLKKCSINIL